MWSETQSNKPKGNEIGDDEKLTLSRFSSCGSKTSMESVFKGRNKKRVSQFVVKLDHGEHVLGRTEQALVVA
ncbi:CLUMA_CG010505, isoform A [Clunio marinus]|uniref:CLUMA_CG010505, isoform A n=1 Tax=Clunio marinus TaxID=568069 RepID=A0A1J1I9V9_9DIPT|nr:CLUMA_CG010505, isoform A [Clunio marinus]